MPFKVIPLGSHTPLEKLLPLSVAVLEVFMWKCPQLLCHNLLDVVHSSKITTIDVEFEFGEKKEVMRNQIRRVWGLRNPFRSKLLSYRLGVKPPNQNFWVRTCSFTPSHTRTLLQRFFKT
jgi:hypothetical protein